MPRRCPRAGSAATRSSCPRWRSNRSGPAAAPWPRSTAPASCGSARRAPAPGRARPATAPAGPPRRGPTPPAAPGARGGAPPPRRPVAPPRRRAAAALAPIADALGLGLAEAAAGVLEVANAAMRRAIRLISVQRGFDLREFTLIAYGGAGPLHGGRLAQELGMPRVVVPAHAGLF